MPAIIGEGKTLGKLIAGIGVVHCETLILTFLSTPQYIVLNILHNLIYSVIWFLIYHSQMCI